MKPFAYHLSPPSRSLSPQQLSRRLHPPLRHFLSAHQLGYLSDTRIVIEFAHIGERPFAVFDFFDDKVRIGKTGDLGQMGDRDNLMELCKPFNVWSDSLR